MKTIALYLLKVIVENVFVLLKETFLSPVKVTVGETKYVLPSVSNGGNTAKLVSNFVKLHNKGN